MSAANSYARVTTDAASVERERLFKQDRPRHIDQYISFFGDDASDSRDACGEALLEALNEDR